MRILYFADIRFPLERANGIQTMETCGALAARGLVVDLVVRPDTHKPARDPFEYYGVPRIPSLHVEYAPSIGRSTLRRTAYLAFALGRAAGRARADAVITRDLGVASLLLRAPHGRRPPVVYESHGYAPEVAAALPEMLSTASAAGAAKLRRLEKREARVWRAAEGYVTITAALAVDLVVRFGERPRVAVIPDGVRIAAVRQWSPPEAASSPVVAYAGHLYAWKGVDALIHAIARVGGARGLIIGGHEGEPDLARVRALAHQLGVDHRMTFTGLVPPPRVADLLRRASILVLPNPASAISTRFTSPLKLFEYLAAGRPIVASDLPSIREVVQNGETALLVAAGDPDALAAAIRRIAGDPQLAERLGRAAFAAATEYSWERRAERLEALIQQVVDS